MRLLWQMVTGTVSRLPLGALLCFVDQHDTQEASTLDSIKAEYSSPVNHLKDSPCKSINARYSL